MTTLIIEGTLFISIFVMFIAVDWTAALAIAAYFGLVVFILQLATARRYLQSGRNLQRGAVGAGASVLEMADIFREMFVLSKQDFYLSRFVEAKKLSARTGVTLQILKGSSSIRHRVRTHHRSVAFCCVAAKPRKPE
jgi:hypothetical protein